LFHDELLYAVSSLRHLGMSVLALGLGFSVPYVIFKYLRQRAVLRRLARQTARTPETNQVDEPARTNHDSQNRVPSVRVELKSALSDDFGLSLENSPAAPQQPAAVSLVESFKCEI